MLLLNCQHNSLSPGPLALAECNEVRPRDREGSISGGAGRGLSCSWINPGLADPPLPASKHGLPAVQRVELINLFW